MAGKKSNQAYTMTGSNIPWVIEWLWVPLWVAVGELFRRYFSMTTRVSVLERIELDRKSSQKDLADAIKAHNDTVLTAIKSVSERTAANGHRLGTIESHLISLGKD